MGTHHSLHGFLQAEQQYPASCKMYNPSYGADGPPKMTAIHLKTWMDTHGWKKARFAEAAGAAAKAAGGVQAPSPETPSPQVPSPELPATQVLLQPATTEPATAELAAVEPAVAVPTAVNGE